MAVINTGLLASGLRSEFFATFEQEGKNTFWERFVTKVASTKDKESYKWLGTVPQVREWKQGRVAKGLIDLGYDIANLKYESTIEVDRDEIDDDQTGQIRIRVQELAQRAATHKDELLTNLLLNGSNSGFHSYDGVPFFDASHSEGSSGSQDNELDATASSSTTPTAAECRVGLRAAITTMMNFKDDQGLPMNIAPTGLVVVCPPRDMFTWREALNAQLISTGGTNVDTGLATIVSTGLLTTANDWYLLKTDGIVKPFIFQDRRPIDFVALAEGSEEEFKREKYLYGVSARYAMRYGRWQYAIRTTWT